MRIHAIHCRQHRTGLVHRTGMLEPPCSLGTVQREQQLVALAAVIMLCRLDIHQRRTGTDLCHQIGTLSGWLGHGRGGR